MLFKKRQKDNFLVSHLALLLFAPRFFLFITFKIAFSIIKFSYLFKIRVLNLKLTFEEGMQPYKMEGVKADIIG